VLKVERDEKFVTISADDIKLVELPTDVVQGALEYLKTTECIDTTVSFSYVAGYTRDDGGIVVNELRISRWLEDNLMNIVVVIGDKPRIIALVEASVATIEGGKVQC